MSLVVALAALGCRERSGLPPPAAPSATLDSGTFASDPDAGVAPTVDAGTTSAADAGSGAVDAGSASPDSATSAPSDAGANPTADAGSNPPPSSCNDVTFTYDAPNARTVWVTGSWTNWDANPPGAIELSQGVNGIWSVTTRLDAGRHIYKLIVDGTQWQTDPNAAEREDDGFGGHNSVVEVCAGGFALTNHTTDAQARTFTATIRYDGGEDLASAAVTLDWQPIAFGTVQVQGDSLVVAIEQLTDGIHDVRVRLGDASMLLKVYINESTDWRDTVLYFAMTDRFKNGNVTNDAPVGNVLPLTDYMGGDFAGITDAIQDGYFDELAVNALWISWPTDNPEGGWDGYYPTGGGCHPGQNDFAVGKFSGYHGYWPASGRDIEARFGTMDELKAMVVAAHANGIRVVLDFTANHVHTESPYYANHANDWFNQPPAMCGDGHWDDHLREECWFEPYLADWNYTRPDARRQVLDDAVWLAKETGADGFRVDALKHMEDSIVYELRSTFRRELELTGVPFYMVGETFTGDTGLINRYVGDDMVHAQFDFPANYAIRQAFAHDEIGLGELHSRVRGIKAAYGANAGLMSTFVGNHDIARFISKASGDLGCGVWSVLADRVRAFDYPPQQPTDGAPYRRLELAMTYAFTVPGVPLLYYGDEVGLAGAGDPDNRRMLPEDSALNGEQTRTRAFMARLGAARAAHQALRTGDWTDALWEDDTVLVFARHTANDKAIIVINRGGERTISIDVSAAGLGDGDVLAGLLDGAAATVSGTSIDVTIGAMASEIFVRR